jgi:hypothetical protein
MEMTLTKFRVFATDSQGREEEITDLYWFEENGVHDWGGETYHGEKYSFRFVFSVSDKKEQPTGRNIGKDIGLHF